MWNPDWLAPEPSFREPIDDPGTAPSDSPLVCIFVSKSWQALMVGAMLQFTQPASWNVAPGPALNDVLQRGMDLLQMVAFAEVCVPSEDGVQSITILAGDGTASVDITFTGTYTAAPVVLVSTDDIELTASVSNRTTTGCTLHLTSDVPVIADTTGNVLWGALT